MHVNKMFTSGRWTACVALAAVAFLLLGPVRAQTTPDSSPSTLDPSAAAKIPVVFRGLSGSDTLRVGATRGDSQPTVAIAGGTAQADLDPAQA